ncbi:MAG TPA: pyridoxamine 5'-phosphate oxidase [Flavobacteriaceae bacterium]|nr:pyridoxamine 5'-phosphate oxidase [Flavobacteriaceae bacterium]
MEKDLAYHRKAYTKSELRADLLTDNPMELFKNWFEEVEEIDRDSENNAMTLSSIDTDGFPHNRIVLLKKFNDDGFVFFTNYSSAKGKSIQENPKVSLSFFWPLLERQVIVRGNAEKLSDEGSDEYFNTRPRGSQIGAWVSHQSQPIENREVLENRQNELEKKFENKPIPRPEFWGGFMIKPIAIEFWQGRPNRLHDRFLYELKEGNWKVKRLAP